MRLQTTMHVRMIVHGRRICRHRVRNFANAQFSLFAMRTSMRFVVYARPGTPSAGVMKPTKVAKRNEGSRSAVPLFVGSGSYGLLNSVSDYMAGSSK